MKARDLMTTDVATVPPQMPVLAVARLLSDRHISAVPVVDPERRVLGIVSEADLLRQVSGRDQPQVGFFASLFSDPTRMATEYAKAHGRTARDIMTDDVTTVTEDASAAEIATLLDKQHIRRVVVAKDGRLSGIVSRADLLRALVAPAATGTGVMSDEEIHRGVSAAMKNQAWASTFYTTLVVENGVVAFYGYCGSEEYRRALKVLAEGVPGVKRVDDHLVIGPLYVYA